MRKKNILKNKKILICCCALLILIIIVFSCRNRENVEKKYESTSEFQSIQEIVEYFGSKYINEIDNKKKAEFKKEIYIEFKYNTFENKVSKKEYYDKIINGIVNFLDYENFKIFDEKQQIVIEVKCDNKEKQIKSICINGNYNYFNYMESIYAKENSKETKITEVQDYSELLESAINNNWKYNDINFGTKESEFNKYDIYFDEGIEVRVINRKVYNLIFNKKYQDTIINSITMETSLEQIEDSLGEATFKYDNGDQKVIGYKTSKMYIFFSNDEISIYPVEEYDYEEFSELVTNLKEISDLEDFTNQVTYLWKDYDYYKYDTEVVELRYTLKGIKIGYNIDEKCGILIYNNSKEKLDSDYVFYINEDLVFETEIDRITKREELYEEEDFSAIDLYDEENEIIEINQVSSNEFDFKYHNEYMCFISKNGNYPNSEFTVDSIVKNYFWISDNLFLYTLDYKGIYIYDAIEMKREKIVNVDSEIEIKSFENNILKYNEEQIEIKK